MDLKQIDRNNIEIFGNAYSIACDRYEEKPEMLSAGKQKKLRRFIERNLDMDEYPERVLQYIGKEVSDADFHAFMKACYEEVQENGTERKQRFDRFSEGLDEEVKSAIWCLIEQSIFTPEIRRVGNDVEIDVEFGEGYERTLILKDAENVPEGKWDTFCFADSGGLLPDGNGYKLVGTAEKFETEEATLFAIRFSGAAVRVSVYRADEAVFFLSPWYHLHMIGNVILEKAKIPGEYLNEKEKALLPLLREIRTLTDWYVAEHDVYTLELPHLKKYALDCGLVKLAEESEAKEGTFVSSKQRSRAVEKLHAVFNMERNEALWRRIFDEVRESQAAYPSCAYVHAPDILEEKRREITEQLAAHGYSGTYPDFIKIAPIRGVHLAESYNMSYFVGPEKCAARHIHCTEVWFNDHVMIEFLCGTQLLRKNKVPGDIWSCLFNAKGRRYYNTISYECDYTDEDGTVCSQDLNERTTIAVKKAELRRLTKAERKAAGDVSGWILFLLVFIIMGGLFGLAMTLGFMVLLPVILFLLGEGGEIGAVYWELSWLDLFLIAWVLFGGAMGLITVWAKRK